MYAEIEALQPTPGGWWLRFRSRHQEDFEHVVSRIKALPKFERRWNPHALGGRGAWFISTWGLERIGMLFTNYATMNPKKKTPPAVVLQAFRVLQVPFTCSLVDVKGAYRTLALAHHPDRGGDHQRMVAINQAYKVICTYLSTNHAI